ncbi:MAG: trehalose-phosphatase [Firmicutes bacterium]|nr:trehalose-phosphatase [Bacillota bacterium]
MPKMPALTTPRELAELVRRAGQLFLFCDYDGTLVPIAPTPAEARPDSLLIDLLGELAALPGVRVALVSGRGLADLSQMIPVPGLYLVGCHGAELRRPGGDEKALAHHAGPALAQTARRMCRVLEGRRGFWLEQKKYSLALHYRLAGPGEASEVLEAFRLAGDEAARRHGLVFTPGKKVLELRPGEAHKGAAVLRLLEECPGALPVYLGDDTTDEDAFAALGGRGVTVLVARESRPSAAGLRLPDPVSVRHWCRLLKDQFVKL